MEVELVRAAPVRSVAPARLPEIDVLKAVAIVVVVLIHSARPQWSPLASGLERWLGGATRFAVPAFLFASGCLAARDLAPVGNLGARLRRLLIPYVLASAVAEVYNAGLGYPWTWSSVLQNLALGNAFGPYYYVFVACQLVLLTPVLARAPRALRLGLLGVSLCWQLTTEIGLVLYAPMFWHVRLPLLWLPYFLAGWLLAERRQVVADTVESHGGPLAVGLATAVVGLLLAMALTDPLGTMGKLLSWVHTYAMIALLVVVGMRALRSAPALLHLSDSTYFIYLYHLPFVYSVMWMASARSADCSVTWLVPAWAAGLGIPLLALHGLQGRFGARTRPVLGA